MAAVDAYHVDAVKHQGEDALLQQAIFPFLKLPRELRDHVRTSSLRSMHTPIFCRTTNKTYRYMTMPLPLKATVASGPLSGAI